MDSSPVAQYLPQEMGLVEVLRHFVFALLLFYALLQCLLWQNHLITSMLWTCHFSHKQNAKVVSLHVARDRNVAIEL